MSIPLAIATVTCTHYIYNPFYITYWLQGFSSARACHREAHRRAGRARLRVIAGIGPLANISDKVDDPVLRAAVKVSLAGIDV